MIILPDTVDGTNCESLWDPENFLASHISIAPEPFQRTDISMKALAPAPVAIYN